MTRDTDEQDHPIHHGAVAHPRRVVVSRHAIRVRDHALRRPHVPTPLGRITQRSVQGRHLSRRHWAHLGHREAVSRWAAQEPARSRYRDQETVAGELSLKVHVLSGARGGSVTRRLEIRLVMRVMGTSPDLKDARHEAPSRAVHDRATDDRGGGHRCSSSSGETYGPRSLWSALASSSSSPPRSLHQDVDSKPRAGRVRFNRQSSSFTCMPLGPRLGVCWVIARDPRSTIRNPSALSSRCRTSCSPSRCSLVG